MELFGTLQILVCADDVHLLAGNMGLNTIKKNVQTVSDSCKGVCLQVNGVGQQVFIHACVVPSVSTITNRVFKRDLISYRQMLCSLSAVLSLVLPSVHCVKENYRMKQNWPHC